MDWRLHIQKRALSVADVGCEQGGSQRKTDFFSCTLQPEGPPVSQHTDDNTSRSKSRLKSDPAVTVLHQAKTGAVALPNRHGMLFAQP